MSRHETGASAPLDVVVRPGVLEDIPQLVLIQRHERPTPRRLQGELTRWIESDIGMLLVAVVEGRVVGYVSAEYVDGQRSWLAQRLFVAPDVRRRGVAKALCTNALERVDEQGATCSLWVEGDNTGAIALYERLGFEPLGAIGQHLAGFLGMVRPRQRELPGLTVRPAHAGDLPAIHALANAEPEWDPGEPGHLEDLLHERATGMLLVAELDQRIVGYLAASGSKHEGLWWAEHLLVSPGSRRRGIARELAEFALRRIDRDRSECVLWVEVENVGAVALYRDLGFELAPEFGGTDDGVMAMRRPIRG